MCQLCYVGMCTSLWNGIVFFTAELKVRDNLINFKIEKFYGRLNNFILFSKYKAPGLCLRASIVHNCSYVFRKHNAASGTTHVSPTSQKTNLKNN